MYVIVILWALTLCLIYMHLPEGRMPDIYSPWASAYLSGKHLGP